MGQQELADLFFKIRNSEERNFNSFSIPGLWQISFRFCRSRAFLNLAPTYIRIGVCIGSILCTDILNSYFSWLLRKVKQKVCEIKDTMKDDEIFKNEYLTKSFKIYNQYLDCLGRHHSWHVLLRIPCLIPQSPYLRWIFNGKWNSMCFFERSREIIDNCCVKVFAA